MRFVSFERDGDILIGLRDGDEVIDLSIAAPDLPTDMVALLEAGDSAMALAAQAQTQATAEARIPYADLTFAPVVPRPPKVICIGRNYAAHAAEGGAETPTYPEIFYRGGSSLIGHEAPIVRPKCSDKLDYEGEIVAIVGKKARHVPQSEGLDYIAGYALFNDATLRDYQRKSSQWTIGKNFDDTGAFGPEFVTADELPAGVHGLNIQTRLNGEIMQDASTADLVFPMDMLIAILSECMTLEPGDIIVTGTPSGVGYVRKPPVFMKAGDVCEVEVEGLGVLRNSVIDEQ